MAKMTHGLGRGLDSLLPETENWGTTVQEIAVGDLDPNTDQPRKTFNDESLEGLADSIRTQGVLQPLLVVATSDGRYRIVAGERRYRASRLAGLETIPCIVKELDIIHQMEIALIENLQREDLNPLDTARGIRALMQQCGYTQEKVSARLGKSRPAVANILRLLTLPDELMEMVRDGRLTAGHARVLAGVEDVELQKKLAQRVVDEGLNVRQLEALAAHLRGVKPSAGKRPRKLPAEFDMLQEKLLEKTGLKAKMTGSVSKGRIVLQYSTRDELEHLNEILDRLEE